jgi:hypothetical protein
MVYIKKKLVTNYVMAQFVKSLHHCHHLAFGCVVFFHIVQQPTLLKMLSFVTNHYVMHSQAP